MDRDDAPLDTNNNKCRYSLETNRNNASNGTGAPLKANRKVSGSKIRRQRRLRQVRPTSSAGMTNIEWPQSAQFDVDLGRQKIIEFIEKTWEYNTSSLDYEVSHIYTAQLTSAKRYKYRVCWSWMDTRKRSSKSTASVYFNVDVPLNEMPKQVQVTYTFQKDKLLHRPGRSRYHQKFLTDLEEGVEQATQASSA